MDIDKLLINNNIINQIENDHAISPIIPIKDKKEKDKLDMINMLQNILRIKFESKLSNLEKNSKNHFIIIKMSILEQGSFMDLLRKKRMLEIRQELSKTNTKKYDAMETAMGTEDRVRGLLQFYGANRTGRWAGRLVQVQNLPQNHLDMLSFARELVKNERLGTIQLIYRKHSKYTFSAN